MLYMAGVDLVTAQKQMGHADSQTTLNIYTHLNSIYQKKEMRKLDEFLG
jgi:integrase